ncbi:MAG: acyltransferase [Candidatus Aminicenantes bacterium]|jgi:1-acyl-sn-glycerol-3-phosphate acyltransferase|nr:MAG: acyltransferase [Candidatus Aminicenantes bacterium]
MNRNDVPALGETTPWRGNAFSAALGRWFLGLLGWCFHGSIPDVSRAVIIVAPHTSNIDFFIGVAVMFALGLRVRFLGKHTLFFWPLGPVMRWLGGIPVDRRVATGVVDQTVRLFATRDQLILALAPEGTRKSVGRWKTGFYFVAQEAGVPIVPIAFDYRQKRIRIGERFDLTGSLEDDLRALERFFFGAEGRRDR